MIDCCMVGKYYNNLLVCRKLLFPQHLLYNRGYNVAPLWQRLFSFVSVLSYRFWRLYQEQLILVKISILATNTTCISISVHPRVRSKYIQKYLSKVQVLLNFSSTSTTVKIERILKYSTSTC